MQRSEMSGLDAASKSTDERYTNMRLVAIINQASDPNTTVSLFSGGGAGHEPAHAQYVGNGMLAGAISGSIFASPSVAQIVNGVTHLQGKGEGGGKGVLLIVKNYTGDVLHFNLAASKLRTAGVNVEVVVVGDDVSVGRAKSGRVGRRGLAGTVGMKCWARV